VFVFKYVNVNKKLLKLTETVQSHTQKDCAHLTLTLAHPLKPKFYTKLPKY